MSAGGDGVKPSSRLLLFVKGGRADPDLEVGLLPGVVVVAVTPIVAARAIVLRT